MSFLAAFHAHRQIWLGTPTIRTFLRCAMVRRIAAGALDSPVLQVLGVDSDACTRVNRTMARPERIPPSH
ncbi:hypothetical protein AB0H73_28050 [Streptomyces olivoreticuli]